MKTLHISILIIATLVFVISSQNLASAQSPDVACGWVTVFHKYEFIENDTIPITIHDPCYPQEGTNVTVTVSDGDTTNITGKYLNQTIIATNNTATINFKKPIDSQQYKFLVAIGHSEGDGSFIFTKPNASKLTIIDPFISSSDNAEGKRVIHAKLIDGLGNPVTGAIWGVSIHVDFLIPQCDYGTKCPIPNLDLTQNPSNQTFDGLIDIPNSLADGLYNLTFTAKSYYSGYQMTSVVIPVSVNYNEMNNTTIPEFPSPLKQFKSGIPAINVKCNQGFSLIIRQEDDKPACVKPDTVQKLIERGWGNTLTPTAWFRYTILDPFESGANAHQNVPWSNYIPANVSDIDYKPWFNGTTIKEYFTSHGVTLLEVRYSSYLLAGPEGVGTTPQRQTDFYFLTLQNDTSQMNQFGFKMINVDPRQDLSVFGRILPLNN